MRITRVFHRFIAHKLARNLRVEKDLIDHRFNSSDKRLARSLLLLARYHTEDTSDRVVTHSSQETLAAMNLDHAPRANVFLETF
jgi:CRP/FNR family cyclic AMP-dependent transcriptional regulator